MSASQQLDPALVAALDETAKALQAAATNALNAEMFRLQEQGINPQVINAAMMSAVGSMLFSVIITAYAVEDHASMLGHAIQQIAGNLGAYRAQNMTPQGVTMQ